MTPLIADQRHHLHEQFKHCILGVWEKQLGRAAAGGDGGGRHCWSSPAIAVMVWDAAHSDGCDRAFSVPPDLAQAGSPARWWRTNCWTAWRDRHSAQPIPFAPPQLCQQDGDDIKMEIPETGISVGELDRFLREWLGHETISAGAVFRTATELH